MTANLLAVAIGGACGSLLRYGLQKSLNLAFPFGTLSANILGCLLIGLLWGSWQPEARETTKLLWMTGFCGGFTTFSAFSQEAVTMVLHQRWPQFFVYTTLSVVAGLLATYAGYKFTS